MPSYCLDCGKRSSYNYKGEKKYLYCRIHKKEGMINVSEKRKCLECDNRPLYNLKGEKAMYCKTHKKEGMVNVNDKRKCLECDTRPTFNLKGEKAMYCKTHKKEGMIDVSHTHCKGCNLYLSQQKYKWLCVICFRHKYPNHPKTTKFMKKEKNITSEIMRRYPDLNMVFNKEISCSKRRPDILIDLYTHSIIIEVDEDQHRNYLCEEAKLNDVFTDLGDRPLILIRINPDKYKDENGNIIKGVFLFDKENNIKVCNKKEYKHRIDTLFETIDKYIPYQDYMIEEIKLFYDK